ncbi:MAG: hypothetical protein M3N22_03830, partial [Acidobacteriota bacterium]|nr:hypothetical protein [Acidobacteriota bacterium]
MMRTPSANEHGMIFCRSVLVAVLFELFLLIPLAVNARPAAKLTGTHGAGDPIPHASADRNGTFETKDGLTLRLNADLGSVRIITLDPSAPPVVRYSVHIETDARAPMAQTLLDKYLVRSKATDAGVEIGGTLPTQIESVAA